MILPWSFRVLLSLLVVVTILVSVESFVPHHPISLSTPRSRRPILVDSTLSPPIGLSFSPGKDQDVVDTPEKSSRTPSSSSSTTTLWTVEQLETLSAQTGVELSFTTLGPGYRAVARAAHNKELVLGYVEGFIRPGGKILHLDKMEVFQPVLKRAKKETGTATEDVSGGEDYNNTPFLLFDFGGISFGVGLMMGYRCLLHAVENGCTTAEFLAIDDDDFIHKRLVRYYRRVGFQVVKYVGEDIKDIPDRLVWGGVGTLMREQIPILTQKWSDTLGLMQTRRTATRRSMKK
jgi:hypothetical protein